jgi:hypothetical protein
MAIPAVRAASGFSLPRCGAGMAPQVCYHGITLVSCHEVSSGTVAGVTIAGPLEGPERSSSQNPKPRRRRTAASRHGPPVRVPGQSRGVTWLKMIRCLQGQHPLVPTMGDLPPEVRFGLAVVHRHVTLVPYAQSTEYQRPCRVVTPRALCRPQTASAVVGEISARPRAGRGPCAWRAGPRPLFRARRAGGAHSVCGAAARPGVACWHAAQTPISPPHGAGCTRTAGASKQCSQICPTSRVSARWSRAARWATRWSRAALKAARRDGIAGGGRRQAVTRSGAAGSVRSGAASAQACPVRSNGAAGRIQARPVADRRHLRHTWE